MKRLVWGMALLLAACSGESSTGSPTDATELSDLTTNTDLAGDAADAADATPDVDLPEPSFLWAPGPSSLGSPDWVAKRPWLSEVSDWSTLYERQPGKEAGLYEFADLALGNGVSFSMIGYKAPLNRLHTMIGPGYNRGLIFFSDTWLEVVDGKAKTQLWSKEWMGRITGTPIVRTEAQNLTLALSTVDVAPLGANMQAPLARSIVRTVVVRNRSDAVVEGAKVVVRCTRPQTVTELGYTEQPEEKIRAIKVLDGAVADKGASELTLPIPTLQPGEEHVFTLAYMMGMNEAELSETHEALLATTTDALLEKARDGWRERLGKATQIVTPDPMVNQYLEAQLIVMLSQTTYGGAVCPMSNYTRSWIRDTSGTARFLLSLGLFEEVRRNLDFLFVGHTRQAGITDILSSDLDPSGELGPEPDWDTLPPGDDHMIAETPCHLPLMHYWYWKASGELDFMPQRIDWMRYAMNMQHLTNGLLSFGGDETYRAAMSVAFDYPLTQEYFTGFYSSYSSFLWIVAARALQDMAEAVDKKADVEDVLAQLPTVEHAMDKAFLRSDGAYLPYVVEGTMEPAPGLFEDVSLQPTWLGLLDPDDEKANKNLQAAIAEIGGEDGYLISPLPQQYQLFMGLPVTKGIYTGMNPGHYLWALAAAEHPLTETVFNTMREHALDTGTTPEYQLLDHFDPLHINFNEMGKEPSDYTARYRPWEGGVNAEAVVFYLLGQKPDAVTNTLRLAPHLPNGWGWMEAKAMRIGSTLLDLRIERPLPDSWSVTLAHQSGDAVTIDLRIPWPTDTAPTVTVDGQTVTAEFTTTYWGSHRILVMGIELPTGAKVVVAAH